MTTTVKVQDDLEMCGSPCPDGWPCVEDAGHNGGHMRADGFTWDD